MAAPLGGSLWEKWHWKREIIRPDYEFSTCSSHAQEIIEEKNLWCVLDGPILITDFILSPNFYVFED